MQPMGPYGNGNLARMRTNPLFTHSSNKLCVSFWYHMKTVNKGDLSVFYLQPGQRDTRIWIVTGSKTYSQLKGLKSNNLS